jgi:hypothetical protein
MKAFSTLAGQLSIFDIPPEQATKEAIEAVEAGTNDAWKNRVMQVIRSVCERQEKLTADDIDDAMSGYPETTGDKRAMGAMFVRAQAEGLIASTPEFRPSRNPKSHLCPRRVWRSLVIAQELAGH